MRAASIALLLALLAGACAGPDDAARPVEASAEAVAAGSVQFGIVVDPDQVPAGPTAAYPHWDAHGA